MTDDNDLFDYAESKARRDEGMDRVEESNPEFSQQFLMAIANLPSGWVGTCEDIRRDWRGVEPSHPNAWGSCWGGAKRRGLLVELPDRVAMTAVKSHARRTHLHRRV
jgi:hypothetical protein